MCRGSHFWLQQSSMGNRSTEIDYRLTVMSKWKMKTNSQNCPKNETNWTFPKNSQSITLCDIWSQALGFRTNQHMIYMTARHEVTACGTSTNSPESWSVMQAPWPPGWLSLRLPLLASVSGTHLHILGTSSLGTYTYNQTLFSLLYITLFLLNFKVQCAVNSSFPFTECLSLSNSRFNVLLLVSVMKMVKP